MSNKKRLREVDPHHREMIENYSRDFLQWMERLRPFVTGQQIYERQHHQWVRDAQRVAWIILGMASVDEYQENKRVYDSAYFVTRVDPTEDPRRSYLQRVFQ